MRRWPLLLLVALLVSCGDDTPVAMTPPTTQPPPPPPPRVVIEGSGSLEVDFVGRLPFISPLPGRLDVTVDWTFATNDVDVYLARGVCSFDQFFDDMCDVIATAESFTAKPERLSVASAGMGSYTLFVGNFGPEDESLSWQVVLTPSGAALGGDVRALTRSQQFESARRPRRVK